MISELLHIIISFFCNRNLHIKIFLKYDLLFISNWIWKSSKNTNRRNDIDRQEIKII